MTINTRPLTPEREEDFFTFFEQTAFSEHAEWGAGCYCCFFHATDEAEWSKRTDAENRSWAQVLIRTGRMHGILAYDGQTPVGWCHYDRIGNLPGVRVFRPGLPSDDPDTAAIVCFTVAQGYRGQGVATQLLTAALGDLATDGFKRAQAYPVAGDGSPEENYPGPLALYRKLGFHAVKTINGHTLVEKAL